MAGVDLQLPGGVRIQTVQDLEVSDTELAFLLRNVPPEEFAATAAARDARFVNLATGRLRMSYHSTVVRTPQGNVLIDTCIGNHKHRPLIEIWHMQTFPYLERLGELDLTPADIDFVCCTHFHADHVGWNTRLDNGRWVPTFPNARYLFAEPEYNYWDDVQQNQPQHIFTQSWNDSISPVVEARQADIVSVDHEVLDGIRLQPAFGHSPGNIVVAVDAGGQRALMSGDVMHHPVQIERPDWNSVFDQDVAMAQATRARILESVADGNTYLIGSHFAGPTALQVTESNGRFSYR